MKKKITTALIALFFLAAYPVQASTPDNYTQLANCVQKYDKAVQRGDLQQSLKAQERALQLWYELTPAEKRRLEREYGSMFSWLQSGADYDGNNLRASQFARRR